MDRLCFQSLSTHRRAVGGRKTWSLGIEKMWPNVTEMMNGTQSISSCFNLTAKRIGETLACCLLFIVSLAANTFIRIIVYRTKTLRTPINILVVNMAISDLLFPIFHFPKISVNINTAGHWLVSGPLGQAMSKLSSFATDVSTLASVRSLLLIAVDRFGTVVFPLRFRGLSPWLHSSRICSRSNWSNIIMSTSVCSNGCVF